MSYYPLYTYSMTAGVIWLALQRLGIESTIYDESWTGYAQRKESVIARGE
jgi:thiosulfate/3-mercaptopyruvate sulfurtransferase